MEIRKRIYCALGGFILGVLVTLVICLCIVSWTGREASADSVSTPTGEPETGSSPGPDVNPSGIPTIALTGEPETGDNPNPDAAPSGTPTIALTGEPETGDNPNPDAAPSSTPTGIPTEEPETGSSPSPSADPSVTPTGIPTEEPEAGGSPDSSADPSATPTIAPTRESETGDSPSPDADPSVTPTGIPTEEPEAGGSPDSSADPSATPTIAPTKAPEPSADPWDQSAVYTGGDTVSYGGRRYRAKWWTQGEQPDRSDVWEDLGIVDGEPAEPEGVGNVPVDASVPKDTMLTDFKVVGYYPSWKPDKLSAVDFGVLTHVCYAFAIPTIDGGLRDLENPGTAKALIKSAHANGAKVLLSIGGWSYNDTPLENVFMEATSDDARTSRFAENIIAMCEEYGFDGVDMDWEHPRVDGASARQYEALMLILSEKLHAGGKLLTAAVLSGATADGNIYYDAAAHTNAVLNAVDFINIMAYDGGDGERHSQYQFAVDCGIYWKETRGLPAHKVVLGVPFYARPSWADYGTILESVPDAYGKDHVTYNGMDVYYNGVDTIAKKTRYAKENLGGIMIWELTQDAADAGKSLLQTIGESLQ